MDEIPLSIFRSWIYSSENESEDMKMSGQLLEQWLKPPRMILKNVEFDTNKQIIIYN